MSIIILVILTMFLLLITRYINFMLIPIDLSRYLSLSFTTFYVNYYDFYNFFVFTIQIFIHLFLCSFRSIHIYCQTYFSISLTHSLSLGLLMSYLRFICLFLVFMNLFFIALSLCRYLLIFRYRSFKNIKK